MINVEARLKARQVLERALREVRELLCIVGSDVELEQVLGCVKVEIEDALYTIRHGGVEQ